MHSEKTGVFHVRLIKLVWENGAIKGIMGITRHITERKRMEEKLRHSEQQFRLVWEKAADGMRLINEQGTVLMVNEAFCRFVEKEQSELLGKSFAVIYEQEQQEDFVRKHQERFKSRTVETHYERELILWNGRRVWIEVTSSFLELEEQSSMLLSIFRDITDRKQTEEALRKSELRFKQVSENAQEWIWEHDCNGLYTYVSPVCNELLGYEAEEIVGIKYFYEFFESKNRDDLKKAAFEAIARKESFRNFINCNIHKDGRKIILSTSGVPILDNENNLIGYRGVDVDITERVHAEELLRQSEIKLQVIIESTADGILAIDGNGKVIKTNNRFAELWKIPPAILNSGDDTTLLNFVLEQLVNPKQFLDKVQQLYNSTDEDSDTLFFKDGRIFERYSAPLLLDDKIIGRVWSFRDITGRKYAEEALKVSEEKYRILAESSPEMIYLIDTKGYITYVNKVAATQFHAPAQALIGKHLTDIFPPDLAQQNLAGIQDVIATKSNFQSEVEMVFPTGNRWVDARLTPVFDEKNNVIGVLGLSYDITERKKAEEKIKLLAHAVKNTADCIIITNKDLQIIFVNDSFCKVYGYNEEEIIGQPIAVITSMTNLPEIDNDLFSTIAKKEIWTGQVLNKRKDGTDFPVQLSLSPLLTDKGELIAFVAVLRDITERKQAEEALRASQQIIEGIINTIPFRLFWKDKDSVYLGCNTIFARDAGFSDQKDIIGKDDFQMGWRDQAELYRNGDRQVMESGCPILLNEEPQTTPEGNTKILLTNKLPLLNSMGEIYGILGTSMDITDRIAAEQEIKLKNEELQKLNTEKDKFFSIIAHDLRSPFSGFLGLTEIMEENIQTFSQPELADFSRVLNESAKKLSQLLENLLEWAQMQKGSISYTPKELSLSVTVSENIEQINQRAVQKEITIRSEVPENQKVFADERMINSVVRNLLTNAVKFTGKGGEVTIASKLINDDRIEISVHDTGIGISDNNLAKLFKIDEKVSSLGTDGESSTGLGLLLCKEFVGKHGGRIGVESEEGKGSTFYFTIPCPAEPEGKNILKNVVSADGAESQINPEGSGLKILIAEDDKSSGTLISITVRKFGKDIIVVRTGTEAVETCRNNPDIDLVLMDIQMPEMDGYEATRQIRQFNTGVVIIAQTAFALTGEREKAMEAGCNDYISKPINQALLIESIKKHLKK